MDFATPLGVGVDVLSCRRLWPLCECRTVMVLIGERLRLLAGPALLFARLHCVKHFFSV